MEVEARLLSFRIRIYQAMEKENPVHDVGLTFRYFHKKMRMISVPIRKKRNDWLSVAKIAGNQSKFHKFCSLPHKKSVENRELD
jgi:hypothetical protein